MGVLGLDFKPAIAAADLMGKQAQTLDTEMRKLEKTFANVGMYSKQMARTINDELLSVQRSTAQTGTALNRSLAAEIPRAKYTVNDYFNSTENRARQHKNFMDKTFSAGYFAHHLNFMATSVAIGATLAPLYEAKKVVVDLSASMTKLRQVLEIVPPYDKSPEKLTKDLEELKEVAGVMAVTYGVEFSRVVDVMSQAGRRFKDVASIISATDTALQLTVVDMVPLETAIGSVEAIMSQFGLTTGQAKQALFEISAASHMLQINATDLLEAIKRSGSAFKTMKADTREAVAAISVLAQMTAQKGGMIGNAWKSLEASFASDKGQKALKELGIELFDSNGQLENMSELILRLQEKWQTLSDRAKMHYATVLAGGKFHYQRLEAFLSDYTGAYKKALAGIETANADMQKKLIESTMTSLPQQFRMTEAGVQVLAEALLRDLTPAMILFLSNMREGIISLKEHKDGLTTLLGAGMRLAEAYVLWKVGVAAYTAVVTNAGIQTAFMQGSLLKLELTAKGVPATMAAVAGSIGGVASAAMGAAARIAGFLAILGGLNRAIGYMYDAKGQKVKDLEADLKDVDAYLNYSPGKSLKTAGSLLLEGHPLDAVGQLGNAPWGWMGLNKKYYTQKRDQITHELEAAREEKRKADEEALTRDLKNLDDIIKKYEEEANAKTSEMLKKMRDETPTFDFTGTDSGRLSDFTNPLKESVNDVRNALTQYNDALSLTDTLIQGIGSQERTLDMLIKNQKIPTLEQARQKYTLLGEQADLYTRKQNELHGAAEEARKQLADLEAQQQSLIEKHEAGQSGAKEYNAAMSALRPTINELKRDIAQYGNSWWDAQYAVLQAKDTQEDMVRTFIRSSRELQKENAIDALAKSQKSALNALEQEKKRAMDDLEEAQKARIRSLESARDTEINSLKATKDAYEETSNAKIKAIQAEIDAMELANNLLNEQEELLSRQKDVDEARVKIANVEADKKIRVVGADGQWTYIADEIALREARKDLETAEKALADTQADIRKNARRRELEAQIKQEQDIQKTQIDSYDAQIEAARKAWDDKLTVERDNQQKETNQAQQSWQNRLDNFREAQANEKTALENHWTGMLDAERINQDAMNEILQNGLDGALLKWRNYHDRVRALQQSVSVGDMGGGSSGGGGSGGGWGGADPTGVIPGDYTGPVSGYNNIPSGSSLNSNFQSGVKYQFAKGGPIYHDMIAKVHKKEYVLNAKTVAAMGGFAGVERLVARVNAPDLAGMFGRGGGMGTMVAGGTSYSTINNNNSVDRRIMGINVNLPHVYDVSGFIRNLEQYAAS